jgi:hypothetical protein
MFDLFITFRVVSNIAFKHSALEQITFFPLEKRLDIQGACGLANTFARSLIKR